MSHYNQIKCELDTYFSQLYENSNSDVQKAMHYAMSSGGKRIRPLICAILLDGYGYDYHDYISQIASLELIHTYSLIHDDLPCMDDDTLRRGQPTCHVVFSEAIALLAGDALLTDAFARINENELENAKKMTIVSLLATNAGYKGMIYGQMLDMLSENKMITLEELERIHEHKTGCLIEASFEMAGIIVEKDIKTLKMIGKKLGLAFQIQDDILDVIGDQEILGKPIKSDIKNQKATFVSLLGVKKAQAINDQLFLEIDALILQTQLTFKGHLQAFIQEIKLRNR